MSGYSNNTQYVAYNQRWYAWIWFNEMNNTAEQKYSVKLCTMQQW